MSKLFFASDLHLSHPNILKYESNRRKKLVEYSNLTLEEIENALLDKHSDKFNEILKLHDEMIINNWNNKVKPGDIVIFLGDFAFCQHACKEDKNFNKISNDIKNKIIEYGRRLNGHKIMIMGNHDWRGTYHQGPLNGMHYVSDEVKQFWLRVGFEEVFANPQMFKNYFEISHEPSPYYAPNMCRFNIFGHVHSDIRFLTETENSFCACIDRHNLTPVEFKIFNDFKPEQE